MTVINIVIYTFEINTRWPCTYAITSRNQWVSVGDMSVGRYGHCAVPLSNTIFVAGGEVANENTVILFLCRSLTELLLL